MRTLWLMTGVAFALSGACRADDSCPWMNAATAGGLLGGSATTTVTHSDQNKEDANCLFARPSYSLQISVQTMAQPSKEFPGFTNACTLNATPLKAIGNEAVACRVDSKSGTTAEQVIGRVRDRAFIIRISTTDHSAAPALLREKATKAAEQVAGILF